MSAGQSRNENEHCWGYCTSKSPTWKWKEWPCISFPLPSSTESHLRKNTKNSRFKRTVSTGFSPAFYSFILLLLSNLFPSYPIMRGGQHVWEIQYIFICLFSFSILFSIFVWQQEGCGFLSDSNKANGLWAQTWVDNIMLSLHCSLRTLESSSLGRVTISLLGLVSILNVRSLTCISLKQQQPNNNCGYSVTIMRILIFSVEKINGFNVFTKLCRKNFQKWQCLPSNYFWSLKTVVGKVHHTFCPNICS